MIGIVSLPRNPRRELSLHDRAILLGSQTCHGEVMEETDEQLFEEVQMAVH